MITLFAVMLLLALSVGFLIGLYLGDLLVILTDK